MDRRRGLATSAAIAMTVVSGAVAVWPGLGLWKADRADPVGKFRPVASQAPAGPQVVQVGVPSASATPVQPGPPGLTGSPGAAAGGGPAGPAVSAAVPGTTVPGASAQAGAKPGEDDSREGACRATTSSTGPGSPDDGYRVHAREYGPCPTQTTVGPGGGDDRFDD
jgi:hypothetical protein